MSCFQCSFNLMVHFWNEWHQILSRYIKYILDTSNTFEISTKKNNFARKFRRKRQFARKKKIVAQTKTVSLGEKPFHHKNRGQKKKIFRCCSSWTQIIWVSTYFPSNLFGFLSLVAATIMISMRLKKLSLIDLLNSAKTLSNVT